jgi:hypothetical protein
MMLKTPNDRYSQQPIMAFIMWPQFTFQSAAHHMGHLIPASKHSQLCKLDYGTLASMGNVEM